MEKSLCCQWMNPIGFRWDLDQAKHPNLVIKQKNIYLTTFLVNPRFQIFLLHMISNSCAMSLGTEENAEKKFNLCYLRTLYTLGH